MFQLEVSIAVIPLAIETLNVGSISVKFESLLFQLEVSTALILLAIELIKTGSVSV